MTRSGAQEEHGFLSRVPLGWGRLRTGKWRRIFFSEAVIGYAFLLPLVLVLFGLMAYPVGRALWMSLTDKRPGEAAQFIGLENYRELLVEDSTFPKVVLNSFIYTGSVIGGRFVLGMIMALVLNARFKLREFFRGWLLLPWIMPVVASSLTWTWILNSRGALNHILMGHTQIFHPKSNFPTNCSTDNLIVRILKNHGHFLSNLVLLDFNNCVQIINNYRTGFWFNQSI